MTQLDKFAHFIKFLHFKCKVADKNLRFYSSMYYVPPSRYLCCFYRHLGIFMYYVIKFLGIFEPLPSYK